MQFLPYLGRWIGCEATAHEQGTKCYSNMTRLSAVAWTTPRYSSHMNAQRKQNVKDSAPEVLTHSPPDIAFVVYALEVLCCSARHAEHAAQRLSWEMERPSSPRALEPTGHTYIHTPFSRASGVLLDVPSPFFQFPLCAPEPKYPLQDHPGGAGSSTIGRKPIICAEVLRFPIFLCSPDVSTHTRAPVFSFCAAN